MKNSKDIKKISEGLLGHLQRSLSFKNPQRFSDILKYLRNTNETILINELSFSANFIFFCDSKRKYSNVRVRIRGYEIIVFSKNVACFVFLEHSF